MLLLILFSFVNCSICVCSHFSYFHILVVFNSSPSYSVLYQSYIGEWRCHDDGVSMFLGLPSCSQQNSYIVRKTRKGLIGIATNCSFWAWNMRKMVDFHFVKYVLQRYILQREIVWIWKGIFHGLNGKDFLIE